MSAFRILVSLFVIAALGNGLAYDHAFAEEQMSAKCRQRFTDWQRRSVYKAFAATPVIDGLQGCGWVWGSRQQPEANYWASKFCKRDAQAVFGKRKAACRLIK